MSSKLDLLFTHVEVLRSREPAIDTTPIATMTDGPRPGVSVTSGNTGLQRTLLLRVHFGEWTSTGKSDSKKKAKQIAAKKLLLQIVEKVASKNSVFLVQAKEEAKNYIIGLMPELKNEDAKDVMLDAAKTTAENCLENVSNCAKPRTAKNLYEKIAEIFPPKVCKPTELPNMVQTPDKDENQMNAATVPSSATEQDKSWSTIAAGTKENDSEYSTPTEIKEGDDDQQWKEIQSFLKSIVDNEEDCAVEKVFDGSEMNFIVAEQGDQSGNIQVYLEMLKLVKNQPQNTFTGEGPTERSG
uniref:DRBM domain-containing protein n=1 Tax=Ditylenchus dipsaci TaxID=166011 RepID=A0A915ER05_9BILA